MEITSENFDEQIKVASTMLIDCYTDWCGPCKILKPLLAKIGNENDIEVRFLNIEDNYELGAKLNISNVPTVLVIKNGEVTDRLIGVRAEQEYINSVT